MGFNFVQSQDYQIGMLNGLVNNQANPVDYTAGDVQAAVQARQDAANTSKESWITALPKYIAAAPVRAIDSMAAIIPGIERGAVENIVYGKDNAVAQWVRRNTTGVEVSGGVLGAVAAAMAAEAAIPKLLASGWFEAAGLSKIVAPIVERGMLAKEAARAATFTAAESGKALGLWEGANGVYLRHVIALNVGKAAVGEAAIAATMNQNTAIWDSSAKVNVLYAAMGLSLGAGIGVVAGRAALLRYANSPEITNIAAHAIDPAGYQGSRLRALDSALKADGPVFPKQSSVITNLALDAEKTIDPLAPAAELQRSMSTQLIQEMHKQLQIFTRKGAFGIEKGGFNVKGSAEGKALTEALHKDSTLLLGGVSAAKIPRGLNVSEALAKREGMISLVKSSLTRKQVSSETPLLFVNGGWQPVEDSLQLSKFVPNRTAYGKDKLGQIRWKSQDGGLPLSLSSDGRLSKPWQDLTDLQRIEARDAMNRLITSAKIGKYAYRLPTKASFIELDMAAEMIDKGAKVDLGFSGFASLDALRLKSLKLKAKALKSLGGELSDQARFKLNLPQLSNLERVTGNSDGVLKSVLSTAQKQAATYQELSAAYAKGMQDVSLFTGQQSKSLLDGGIFQFNKNRAGDWVKPFLGFFDSPPAARWSNDTLDISVALHKLDQVATFKNAGQDSLLGRLTNDILNHPSSGKVMNVDGLLNNQVAYLKNTFSMIGGQFLSNEFKTRNSAVLKAAADIIQLTNKAAENQINTVMRTIMPQLEQLSSIVGVAKRSNALYGAYYSFAGGWDIKSVQALDNGLVGFVLDNTELNAKRLGRNVGYGELMKSPITKQPLVLDKAANELRVAMERVNKEIWKEKNLLRKARGAPPIKFRKFYVNPPSIRDKAVGYTVDKHNQLVQGKTIIASTEAEFLTMRAALKLGKDERFYAAAEMQAYSDLWQKLELDFIDPTSIAAPAAGSKGILRNSTIDAQALANTVNHIKDSYEQISNGWIRTVFEPQLKHAAMREAATTNVSAGFIRPGGNIYREFQNILLGTPDHVNPRGINIPLKGAEVVTDQLLSEIHSQLKVPKRLIADLYSKVGVKVTPKQLNASFEAMSKDLGQYIPFKTVDDLVSFNQDKNPAWKTKDVTRKMQAFAAAVWLRWFSVAQSMMNMSGLIINLPGIVGQRSVPLLGSVHALKNGERVGVVDTAKIMSAGMAKTWARDKRTTRDWEYMKRKGYVSQKAADLQIAMGTISNPTSLERLMTGDPKFSDWQGIKDPMKRSAAMVKAKGISGMLAIITDTSEDWSRQIAHFTGLELADHQGITKFSDRHAFANDFANQSIANYNPLNRPEAYQTAYGSLYGTFLSYAQAYYQRLFIWAEQGDYKAIGRNLGMQAALFGTMSEPAAQQISSLLGGDNKMDNVLDNTYKNFGSITGSVIANGGFNQLSTLFGLPAMGLQGRGDASFRTPTLDAITQGSPVIPIALKTITDIAGGMIEIANETIDPNVPMSGRRVAEILARQLPSRVLAGSIAVLFAGGQEADAYGRLMSDTKNNAESAMRIFGIRSLRQKNELAAYYINKTGMAVDAQKMLRVRRATRAIVRAGELNRLPEIFQSYLDAGGHAQNYPNWIQGIIRDSRNTRTENQFLSSMKNPNQQMLAQRIRLYTGQ